MAYLRRGRWVDRRALGVLFGCNDNATSKQIVAALKSSNENFLLQISEMTTGRFQDILSPSENLSNDKKKSTEIHKPRPITVCGVNE